MSARFSKKHRYTRQVRSHLMPKYNLTLTRAIRKSLAAMVQRLMQVSTRFKLVHQSSSRWSQHLSICGWPNSVSLRIAVESLVLKVTYKEQFWDALIWPDCQPMTKHGLWQCMDPGCMDTRGYKKLEDLLFDHLAQPLLSYFSMMPERAELRLFSLNDDGSTWAELVEQGTEMRLADGCIAHFCIKNGVQ